MKKIVVCFSVLLLFLITVFSLSLRAEAANNVIYISDTGTGDGTSPDSPLGNLPTYDVWSENAFESSAIVRAVSLLAQNGEGGTVVVVSPVTVRWGRQNESDAKAASDFRFFPVSLDGIKIRFTSFEGGVDYREKNGAAIVIDRTASQALSLEMRCETEWDDITIRVCHSADASVAFSNNVFACFNFKTKINEGVITEAFLNGSKLEPTAENAKYFPSLLGGSRFNNLTGSTDLTVLSGTWQTVAGGPLGFSTTTYGHLTGNTRLYFGGSAHALKNISGGAANTGGWISGKARIQIGGGRVEGAILAGGSGFRDKTGEAELVISGGDLSKVTEILPVMKNAVNASPQSSSLDYRAITDSRLTLIGSLSSGFDTVVPGERVIFIRDGGTGDGSSASRPLSLVKDPNGAYELEQMNSILYQSFSDLAKTGGTVVLCGEVKLDRSNTRGSSETIRDFFLPTHKDTRITVTSVYNGTDYRKSTNARLVLESPANLCSGGPMIFENLDICTKPTETQNATERIIMANGYDLTFGDGVRCIPLDVNGKVISFPADNLFPIVVGGHRYANVTPTEPYTLTISSGTFYQVNAGTYGITVSNTLYGQLYGNSHLVIEKNADIRGPIYATSQHKSSAQSGNALVEIKGGKFKNSLLTSGEGGFCSSGCRVDFVITGGEFADTFSVSAFQGSLTKDIVPRSLPAVVRLDLSRLNPTLAAKIRAMTSGITDLALPASIVDNAVLASLPAKLNYTVGEKFDPTGLSVTESVGGRIYTSFYAPTDPSYSFSPSLDTPLPAGDSTVSAYFGLTKIADIPIHADLLPTVSMEGAMIRLRGEKQGLRFVAKVENESTAEILEYGIVAHAADYFVEKSLDLVGAKRWNLTGSSMEETANGCRFSAFLPNIPIEEYDLDYTAFAYVICRMPDGNEKTVLSESITRSVKSVADMAFSSGLESREVEKLLHTNVILPVEEGMPSTFSPEAVAFRIAQIETNLRKMATVKWVCPEDADFKDDSEFTSTLQYYKGVTYTGIPYIAGKNGYFSMNGWTALCPPGSIYTGSLGWDTMAGNMCSSAIVRAFEAVIPTQYGSIADSLPRPGHPEYTGVGPITIPDECALTSEIIAANGATEAERAQIVYECYAKAEKGDHLVSTWISAKGTRLGHIRMVDSVHTVRLSDGTIDGANSYLLTFEQCSSMNKTTYTTWRLQYQYKYNALYKPSSVSARYLPIRPTVFVTSYFKTPLMTVENRNTPENIENGIQGTVRSNYYIREVGLTVTDAKGKTVLSLREYPYMKNIYALSSIDPEKKLKALPFGDYHYALEIFYADREETVLSFDFRK